VDGELEDAVHRVGDGEFRGELGGLRGELGGLRGEWGCSGAGAVDGRAGKRK
jgi:hypothetical protein